MSSGDAEKGFVSASGMEYGSTHEKAFGFVVDKEEIRGFLNENEELGTQAIAYGTIDFCNSYSHRSPYIRIRDEAEPAHLISFLGKCWHLPKPTLIISIVGDASKLPVSTEELGALFTPNGAEKEGVWVITNGFYKESNATDKAFVKPAGFSSKNKIPVIGMAPWSCIAAREMLEMKNKKGVFPVEYSSVEIGTEMKKQASRRSTLMHRKKETQMLSPSGEMGRGEQTQVPSPSGRMSNERDVQPLNPNHSHFILVDGGPDDALNTWQSQFEKCLTVCGFKWEGKEDKTTKIPIVSIIIDEGFTVHRSLSMEPPQLAVVGSQSDGFRLMAKRMGTDYSGDDHHKILTPLDELVESIYPSHSIAAISDSDDGKVINGIKMSVHNADQFCFPLVPSFHPEPVKLSSDTTSLSKFEEAMISVLFDKKNIESDWSEQLEQAITWNKVEVARENILYPSNAFVSNKKNRETFQRILIDVLLRGNAEFMKLLLASGINLRDFISDQVLEELHSKAMGEQGNPYSENVTYLYHRTQKRKNTTCGCPNETDLPEMVAIGGLIKELVGHTWFNTYKYETKQGRPGKKFSRDDRYPTKLNDYLRKDPAQHFMLWAVLFNRMEMAKLFWSYTQDHIVAAIIGGAIMRKLSKRSEKKEGTDLYKYYSDNSRVFEEMAIKILDICWKKDRELASKMLLRMSNNWAGVDLLSMAFDAGMKRFISQPGCYVTLSIIWRGGISLRTSYLRVLWFALCPMMVSLLSFVKSDKRLRGRKEPNREREVGCSDRNIVCHSAIYKAWNSPIVKCIHHTLAYLVFLMVYAAFLMIELKPYEPSLTSNQTSTTGTCYVCCPDWGIGCLEIAIYCYLFAYFVEEFRQIYLGSYMPFRKYWYIKIQNWLKGFWNPVDSLAGILIIIAIVVRFTIKGVNFEAARWLYSFSFIIYSVRFSQLFFLTPTLGPKIIMIKKMFVDMVFFLTVMVMTILIFGVASQAILHPESKAEWSLIGHVIQKPYFQMYGELFLEDYHGFRWILLAIYMVLSTVVLLNLLIAMFSYTFQQVQEQSEILAKYSFCELVFEHEEMPRLPLIGAIGAMLKRCCCPKAQLCCASNDEKEDDDDIDSARIINFVRICTKEYIAELRAQTKQENTDSKTNQNSQHL